MKHMILNGVKKTLMMVLALLIFESLLWTSLSMAANAGEEHHTVEPIASYVSGPKAATETIDIFSGKMEQEAEPEDWFEFYMDSSETLYELVQDDLEEADAVIDISAFVASIDPVTHPGTLYKDSRGAEAYGWEITEAIRLVMLESGAEEEDDIREHCALLCKQLLYTQTVGGWDDWGVTLYGIIHGRHSYQQTAPRIWTVDGNPTDRVTEIFWDVWFNGYSSDFRVQCFRSTCYHTWAIPAYQIGKTYYSINPWQDFSMFELDWDGSLIDILK